MNKKTTTPTKRRPSTNKAKSMANSKSIADTIAELDQLEPTSSKVAKTLALFKSWLQDDSGYDEKNWPKIKKALNQERDRVGARRLFDD